MDPIRPVYYRLAYLGPLGMAPEHPIWAPLGRYPNMGCNGTPFGSPETHVACLTVHPYGVYGMYIMGTQGLPGPEWASEGLAQGEAMSGTLFGTPPDLH